MGHSTILKRAAFLLFALAGCGDDPPFQSLSTLCADLAVDICDARAGGCCTTGDVAACVMTESQRCDAQLAMLMGEDLTFDAVQAAKVRKQARAQLDNCGAPPALASFFEDGLVDGTACQRDGQCAGGACSAGLCALAAPTPLCTAQ